MRRLLYAMKHSEVGIRKSEQIDINLHVRLTNEIYVISCAIEIRA